MSDRDIADRRRSRLKELRAGMDGDGLAGDRDLTGEAVRPRWRGAAAVAGGQRPPGGRSRGFRGSTRRSGFGDRGLAAGGMRGTGGEIRSRILNSLRDVSEEDELIEGTEVGRENLDELVDFLQQAEATGFGGKLVEMVLDLIQPVESDQGWEYSPEGVARLVTFLDQGSGTIGGQAGGVANRTMNRSPGRGQRGRRRGPRH